MKEVQSLHQLRASSPDGPAAPLSCRAQLFITNVSRDSNMTGSKSGTSSSTIVLGWAGWLGGCLSSRRSRTFLEPSPVSMRSSRCRYPLLFSSASNLSVAFVFPCDILLANCCDSVSSFMCPAFLGIRCCIVLPSRMSSGRLPSLHVIKRLWRHLIIMILCFGTLAWLLKEEDWHYCGRFQSE